MSRTWNVDDLRAKLQVLFEAAQQVRVTLDEIVTTRPLDAADAATSAAQARKKEWLECHARDFILDHLLSALNWQLAPEMDAGRYVQSNLVVEQPPDAGGTRRHTLKADENEKRKRMDYLGYERATDRPLLVLEAKRPELQIPGGPVPSASPHQHPVASVVSEYLVRTRTTERIQRRSALTVEWQDYLSQIRAYARELFLTRGSWPKRVALSNGEWIVVISNPEAAFSTGESAIPPEKFILVFDAWERCIAWPEVLWKELEYGTLALAEKDCESGELQFLVEPRSVQSCMYALRVLYAETPAIFERRPLMKVSPVLILRSEGASFIQVTSRWEAVVPNDRDEVFGLHMEEVMAHARGLKTRIEEVLGCGVLPLRSIEEHMGEPAALTLRPAVQELPWRRVGDPEVAVLVVTGTHPHFLVPSAEYGACPFHKYVESARTNMAHLAHPIAQPGRDPRAYFVDGSRFHCTHREVYAPKRQPVTALNRERCGPRSAAEGGAFCEVWRIEEMLCCRTCVYQNVCTGSEVFRIPCPQPQPLVQIDRSIQQPAAS